MPDTIPRRFSGEWKDWPVYSREEADRLGLSYKPWREAAEGEWALSEDDYVAEVVRINGPYEDHAGRERSEVVLPYCRAWTSKGALHYEDFRRRGTYSYHSPMTWSEREVRTRRAQRAIRAYAKLLVEYGPRLPEELMIQLGRLYRSDQKTPEATLKTLLRTQAAKKMVAEELAKLLSEKGITPGEVIENYKRISDKAETKGQLNVAKGIQDRFADMLDMMPDKKAQSPQDRGYDVDWDRVLDEASAPAEIEEGEEELLLPGAEEES